MELRAFVAVTAQSFQLKCPEAIAGGSGRIIKGRRALDGGAEGIRTHDPHNAIVVLYQLSYDPNQSALNLPARVMESQNDFPHTSLFN